MKIGAVFPTTEIGNDPVAIRDYAQAVEALGYDHLLTYDHVLGARHENREPALAGPYTEKDAFHEPMVLFGYLAAVTKRIELVTGILILPQRQTTLVAKQATEIDLLSGGRLRLGVASGWNFVEYEALGMPFAGRGKRLTEQVELIRALWRDPIVDFDGDEHRVDRAGLMPRPTRDIPIWFGGLTDPALRRAARIGDGFIFGMSGPFARKLLAKLQEFSLEEGRSRDALGAEALFDYSSGESTWPEEIEAWREAGGTHVSVRTMDTGADFLGSKRNGFTKLSEHIDALEHFIGIAKS